MNTLKSLTLVKLSEFSVPEEISESQVYKDVLLNYIKNLGCKLEQRKIRHLFELCRLYYIFTLTNHNHLNTVYDLVDVFSLPYWALVQWCACEIVFGHFHDAESCVRRIRLELPWEHQNGFFNEYPLEKFEKALKQHCPDMKGNVHDWCKVLCHVPRKILEYEDFFG